MWRADRYRLSDPDKIQWETIYVDYDPAPQVNMMVMKYEPGPSTARVVLKKELETYEQLRAELEAKYTDEWVVVHGDELVGVYKDFKDAAREAGLRLGWGPYLIRQVAPTDWLEHARLHWKSRAND